MIKRLFLGILFLCGGQVFGTERESVREDPKSKINWSEVGTSLHFENWENLHTGTLEIAFLSL